MNHSSPGSNVEVVQHDARWAEQYERMAVLIRSALGSGAVVHHIGSTAVPAVALAKPVIDVLVEVPSLEAAEAAAERLRVEGFIARGESGIAAADISHGAHPTRIGRCTCTPSVPEIQRSSGISRSASTCALTRRRRGRMAI